MKRGRFVVAVIIFGVLTVLIPIKISVKGEGGPIQTVNLSSTETDTKTVLSEPSTPLPEENREEELEKKAPAERSEEPKAVVSTPEIQEVHGPVVFWGDSLTEGLSAYGFFPEAVIEGVNSLNTLSAREQVPKIASMHPAKLFILLGINDIWEGDPVEGYIERYRDLLAQLKEQTPATKIYIESMLPVSAEALERNPHITNRIIDDANAALREMAKQLQADFIDVNTLMKNEEGNLPSQYTNDGVHLIDYYYPLWTGQLEPYLIP